MTEEQKWVDPKGSSFDDFLKEEGDYEGAHRYAVKEVLAWRIAEAMKTESLSKSEMARRMGTSRAALDRLLDPNCASVTLATLERAALALGKHLSLELVD